MRVLKFGGSSISTTERVEKVIDLVNETSQEDSVAVVFSAFGGVTDQLITLSQMCSVGDESYHEELKELEERIYHFAKTLIRAKHQSSVFAHLRSTLNELEDVLHGLTLIQELTARTLDFIMSFGERMSTFIISEAMRDRGMDAEFADAREMIKTDETFGAARVNFKLTNRKIREYFASRTSMQIITGFIGGTPKDETSTLGRSGSDYTASIFGAALDADEIVIWTDVNGIMTADPRKVPDAFPLEYVTYEEAMEMSHFGAKVVHPSSMQPAFEKNIPIRIRNTFNPEFAGTMISAKTNESKHRISGVSSIADIALLRVQGSGMIGVTGISSRLFGALAHADINIILITQASSEHTICFAVKPVDAVRAQEVIEKEFSLEIQVNQIDKVVVENDLSIIAVVGENMRHTPGIAGSLFRILGKHNVNVMAIAQGSSERNISAVISKRDETTALNAIHSTFFESLHRKINVILVGTGLIGGTLLRQIWEHRRPLGEHWKFDIRVTGLANSQKMFFDPNGISLDNWEQVLESSGEATDIDVLFENSRKYSLTNCVFVDCTASEEVAQTYPKFLKHRIPIVAANKKAASGSLDYYHQLKQLSRTLDTPFLYETNAGASLPIIQTIEQLRDTGDTILQIEAILSGTLSYIFNVFDGETPFSEVVKHAREKGYTEPDPRDDLDGMDVARKLLILARESGYELEMGNITIDTFLPEECFISEDTDDFFDALRKSDTEMTKRAERARESGKVLRFIASLEWKSARVGLQEIDPAHPFFNIGGGDNIVAFTTKRYNNTPLVVKGPGAGAEVTAAGVFADIVRVAKLQKQ